MNVDGDTGVQRLKFTFVGVEVFRIVVADVDGSCTFSRKVVARRATDSDRRICTWSDNVLDENSSS